MSNSPKATYALVGVVALAVGVVATRLLAPPPAPPPIEAAPVINAAPAAASQASGEEERLRRKVRELETTLAKQKAAAPVVPLPAATAPAKIEPEPAKEVRVVPAKIDFPAALPYAYTPQGFRDVIARAIEECKLPYSMDAEDCSEFPCIAWGDWDQVKVSQVDLSECKPWTEAFGQRTMITSRPSADGGPNRMGVYPYPEGATDPRAALARARERVKEMHATGGHGPGR